MNQALAARIGRAFLLLSAATAAEILLLFAITLSQRPPGSALYAGLLLATLKALPLLVLLPFLLRGNRKAAVWTCYAFCFYFPLAVLTVLEPPLRWLGAAEIVASAVVYGAAVLAVRWTRGLPPAA